MSVAKVIEIIGEGNSIEKAVEAALEEAKKTVKNIKHVDVKHIHAEIENNKIAIYRVITKISFIIEH